MAMSYADLEGLWIQAGGSAASAPLAAAIAMAESGGNPSSLNNNASTGDLSYGLWQINMIGSLGPSREQQFGISSYSQLLDPLTNAKAAVKVSNGGTNFLPWSTYKNGAYQRFLNGSVPPNMGAGGSGSTAGGGAPATTISDPITGAVTGVEHWAEGLMNYFFFGLLVASGLVLILAGTMGLTVGTGQLNKASPPEATKEVVFFKRSQYAATSPQPTASAGSPRKVQATRPQRTVPQARAVGSGPPGGARGVPNQAPKRVASERMDRGRELNA